VRGRSAARTSISSRSSSSSSFLGTALDLKLLGPQQAERGVDEDVRVALRPEVQVQRVQAEQVAALVARVGAGQPPVVFRRAGGVGGRAAAGDGERDEVRVAGRLRYGRCVEV